MTKNGKADYSQGYLRDQFLAIINKEKSRKMIKAQIAAFFSLMVMETEAIKLQDSAPASVPTMDRLYWDATTLLQGIADNIC